jgi:acetyl-CoA synthetase
VIVTSEALENLLREERTFAPSEQFAAQANAGGDLYDQAAADRLRFWEAQARELVSWDTEWDEVLDWTNPPFAKWFVGGRLNVAYNCVDRHVEAGYGDQVAIYWEGEPEGESRVITYAQLQAEVNRAANALESLGVRSGERVAIYLPMIPEAAVAMLACARIGAVHSVVFGGFSAEALRSRIEDAEATLVITSDGGYRRGKPAALKPAVDEALSSGAESVRNVLVVRRTGQDVAWTQGRDVWWDDYVASQSDEHAYTPFDSEHPLFILYTSGTTGKPKGIKHTTGGYLTQVAYTHRNVFDLKPETDVYWCTADVGWVTGHSYITYGPLANRATQVMYEGTPDTPHKGRLWEIVAKYGVTIFYTAPTLIRTMMKWGADIPAQFDLSSLRVLGTVGEPINPEAWMWYYDRVGRERCPIVDTWWQTETGGFMITPLPGAMTLKPGSANRPFFGVEPVVLREDASEADRNEGGKLCIKKPWPGMLRTCWGDHERFVDTYFTMYKNMYFTGDGCRIDSDGDYWLLGRIDDVVNVSGHRIGTAEVESALVSHEKVAEAAVAPMPHEIKGQGLYAYVTLVDGVEPSEELKGELVKHVRKEIGPIATPDKLQFAPALPKTRSGKIMRRILRKIAEGVTDKSTLGDTSTLADPAVVDALIEGRQ